MATEVVKSRDSFVFYRSYFEALKELPPESKLALYDTIMESVFCEEVSAVTDPIAKAFMMLITPQIDASLKRYDTSVANGKKRSKATQPKATENPTPTQAEPKSNPKGDLNYNLNDNDNLDDNLDSNENSNKNLSLEESEQAQREKFLEIFFFEKNMRDPQGEVDRFTNHYAAMNWQRKGEPIADRTALARTWEEKQESRGQPRKFTSEFLRKWRVLYDATARHDRSVATKLITDLMAVRETDDRLALAMSQELHKVIESWWSQFFEPFFVKYFEGKTISKIN